MSFQPQVTSLETRCLLNVALTVGPNVNITRLRDNQAETTIAIDPTNPQRLFAAAIPLTGAVSRRELFAAHSTQGGAANTWVGSFIATAFNDSLPRFAADPKAAFDVYGNLFLTYLTTETLQVGLGTEGSTQFTLRDSTRQWTPNLWSGMILVASGETGDQIRSIVSNTNNELRVDEPWTIVPVQNNSYSIWAPRNVELRISTGDNGPNTLRDSTALWTPGGLVDSVVKIVEGTGRGQYRRIIANTFQELTVDEDWSIRPDETSRFLIYYRGGSSVAAAISTDGGQSFRGLRILDTGGRGGLEEPVVDRPSVATGPDPTFQGGSVWFAWRSPNLKITAAGAAVGGLGLLTGFSEPQEVDRGGNIADIKIGPSGQVLVAYESLEGPHRILVNLDPDGLEAQGFGNAIPVATVDVTFGYRIPAQNRRGISSQPVLAWDWGSSLVNGRVYLAYTDVTPPGNSDTYIVLTYSDDAGLTWNHPPHVFSVPGNVSQFFPAIAVDQSTGNVALAWYDTRNDPENKRAQVYASVSSDRGATWSEAVRIGQQLSSADTANILVSGRSTGNNDFYTLNDTHQHWAINEWTGNSVRITGGTGVSQADRIVSNTENQLRIDLGWQFEVPDETSTYLVESDYSFDYGDYIGLDFVDGAFYVAWADNSNGTGDNPDGSLRQMDMYSAKVLVRPAGKVNAVGPDAGYGPMVVVYDADGGEETYRFYAYEREFLGGVRVALGDVNGDSIPDIITGPGEGREAEVRVFDGQDNSLVQSFVAYPGFSMGVYVAAGDVDGDGLDDIIVGKGAGDFPEVSVFHGLNGALLSSFHAFGEESSGGVRVAAGDVNGDGLADIVAGAGEGDRPEVKVFSGLDNSVVLALMVYSTDFVGGIYVAAGDLDGDGLADIIAGPGEGGTPEVRMFRGSNGELLHAFLASDSAFSGGVRVATADIDGDGIADILTGAGPGGDPEVTLFDGSTLAEADRFFAFSPEFQGGVFVASWGAGSAGGD